MAINLVQHPLGPPSISGTEVTVDVALDQPTRVTRYISDITQERFIADRVFTSAGGVTGGAVVYDQVTVNDLFTTRDIEYVAPGAEFPIVTSDRQAPKIAPVEKWGGKTWISDEARDRNNQALLINEMRKVGNTIVQKVNFRAIEVLIAAVDSANTISGHNWATAVPNGSNPTAPALTPLADLAAISQLSVTQELGLIYDLLLVNPLDYTALIMYFGDKLDTIAAEFGINEIYSSPRVTSHAPLAIASGQVGEMRIEQPLSTETWREPGRQRTWMQSSVRPVMYVTNKFGVVQLTGVG